MKLPFAIVRLIPGKEKSLLRRHPWVFAGAIFRVDGSPGIGDTVKLVDSAGGFLAWGAFSPYSKIRVRVWSFREDQMIDAVFFRSRLARAVEMRRLFINRNKTNSFRLVHGESDGLPGLVVDQFGEVLVVQFLSAGVEKYRETLVDLLDEAAKPICIYERSDADVRALEGLDSRVGILRGAQPSAPIVLLENELNFQIDIHSGQKTGFYLDQRNNRSVVRELAAGRKVLDCFCYSGGFSLNALKAGAASVLAVDSSADALELARSNVNLNDLPVERIHFLQGDVFQVLRKLRDQSAQFDLIVLDPPKFAPTISQAERAARGYKDINLLAFKLLNPGGILVTFSCSGGVSAELFQKIVNGAALDAEIQGRVIQHLHQAEDHPVGVNFPEGEYLKGLVVVRD